MNPIPLLHLPYYGRIYVERDKTVFVSFFSCSLYVFLPPCIISRKTFVFLNKEWKLSFRFLKEIQSAVLLGSEPDFLNFKGAQESIPGLIKS